jgi:uncharacterized protein YheU (UPF0270 family)
MSEDDSLIEPVEVPYTALSPEALRGVIEAFVLREGTDYGEREYSLEHKCAEVLAQLQRGEARIYFDPESESVTLEAKAGVLRRRPSP